MYRSVTSGLGTSVPECDPYHELLIDDHLADDGVDDRAVQLEHVCEVLHDERVVHGAVGEQVRPQTLLLDLADDHVTHLVLLVKQVPHLQQTAVKIHSFHTIINNYDTTIFIFTKCFLLTNALGYFAPNIEKERIFR